MQRFTRYFLHHRSMLNLFPVLQYLNKNVDDLTQKSSAKQIFRQQYDCDILKYLLRLI